MSDRRPTLHIPDLRRIRLDLGLEPGPMAERVGISRRHWIDLEAGNGVISSLLENAVRWVEHTRGAGASDICGACDGSGTVRIPEDPPNPRRMPPRTKCAACDGQGVPRHVAARQPQEA